MRKKFPKFTAERGSTILGVLAFLGVVGISIAAYSAKYTSEMAAGRIDDAKILGVQANTSALSVASAAISTVIHDPSLANAPATNRILTVNTAAPVADFPNTYPIVLAPGATLPPNAPWSLDANGVLTVTLPSPARSATGASPNIATRVEALRNSERKIELSNAIRVVDSIVLRATTSDATLRSGTSPAAARDIVNEAVVKIAIPQDVHCEYGLAEPQKPSYEIGEPIKFRVTGTNGFFSQATVNLWWNDTGYNVGATYTLDPTNAAQAAQHDDLSTHVIGASIGSPVAAGRPPAICGYGYWMYDHFEPWEGWKYYTFVQECGWTPNYTARVTVTAKMAANFNPPSNPAPAWFSTRIQGDQLQCTSNMAPITINTPLIPSCGCPGGWGAVGVIPNGNTICHGVGYVSGGPSEEMGLMIKASNGACYWGGSYFVVRLSGCFGEGTLIALADGRSVPVEYLTRTDLVLNPKTGHAASILRIAQGPEKKPMMRLRTTDKHEVTVTDGHIFVTPTGLKRASELRAGDQIAGDGEQTQVVSAIDPVLSETPPNVWNLELDTDSQDPDDHMVLANGIPTGDLYLQEKEANARQALLDEALRTVKEDKK